MASKLALSGPVVVAVHPRETPELLIFLLVVCVVFGLIIYAVFSGILSDDSESFGFHRPPRLRELSPGCLLSIIAAAGLWFLAWTIVLLVAIRLLRTPLGD